MGSKVESCLCLELEMEGSFVSGYPERGPTFSCAGEPAEPAIIEDIQAFIEAEVMQTDDKGNKTLAKDDKGAFIREKKRFYLEGELYDHLLERMEEELLQSAADDEPDPDRNRD